MKTCKKRGHSYSADLKQCPECIKIRIESRKDIISTYKKAYYVNNKDTILTHQKDYYIKNRDELLTRKKAYNTENRDEFLAYKKAYNAKKRDERLAYYNRNRAKILERIKDFRAKTEYKVRVNSYRKTRRVSDSTFKLACNIRSLIRFAFRKGGFKKPRKTEDILGCTFEDFKIHLELTWEKTYGTKYTNQPCHIDHIIPISFAKTEQEVIKLNHYTNLCLLTPEDNRAKGNRIF